MSIVDAGQLLEQVKEFRKDNVAADWEDYERFKKLFHSYGYFGYEKEIADALDL